MRPLPVLFLFSIQGACTPEKDADTAESSLWDRCFEAVGSDALGMPEYEIFDPVVGEHCSGTNHQDIRDIEKVVFLGDSITAGTPPTPSDEVYRAVLGGFLSEEFGDLEIDDCSAYGARTDDLGDGESGQIGDCFAEEEPLRTLVIMTMGCNDMFELAQDAQEGSAADALLTEVDQAVDYLEDAIAWFQESESSRFPAGVQIIFGNVYEYTDGTGDMDSCPAASIVGFEQDLPQLRDAYISINEQYLELAVASQTDLIFMLENFCGHGFHAGESDNECFRGEDAETWFDGTCIHPNPEGHAQIAQMFMDVVQE